MNMNRKDNLIAVFVLLVAAMLTYVWLSPSGADLAPDIEMVTASGQTIAARPTTGKPILINFWATTCETCIKEMPHLIDLHHEFHSRGLEIVGVTMFYDPPSQVMEMVKRKQIPYPVVFDLDKKIMHAFNMRRALTPVTILIDGQGKIVLRKLGMPNMAALKQKIATLIEPIKTDN